MNAVLIRSLAVLTMVSSPLAGAASRADCSHKDLLGTSRVMAVSALETPRVGLKHFPRTLPLADKEVVLTFDDGPFPPTTRRVLAALAAQCVRASFFLIGRNAAANPDLVRKIAADGHTIAHHTWSHRILSRLGDNVAGEDINRGISAVEAILSDKPPADATRFFRFPGFASTPALLAHLESRKIVVFGADLWASDWNRMTPEQELRQVIERLHIARKGVILFHDIRAQTAAMLPAFLRYLNQSRLRETDRRYPRAKCAHLRRRSFETV